MTEPIDRARAKHLADLARRFGVPVLGVIDGTAMAQTFGALALGLARYQPDLPFAGVLANRVAAVSDAARIPSETGITVTLVRIVKTRNKALTSDSQRPPTSAAKKTSPAMMPIRLMTTCNSVKAGSDRPSIVFIAFPQSMTIPAP